MWNKKRVVLRTTAPSIGCTVKGMGMFDNKILASSKQLKLCPRDIIFLIKQEDICDYNPRCLVYSGLILDDIITNLFSDFTKQTTVSVNKDLFIKIQDDRIYLYKGSLQDYS